MAAASTFTLKPLYLHSNADPDPNWRTQLDTNSLLDAKDLTDHWYPSKVIQVRYLKGDDTRQHVLIHCESCSCNTTPPIHSFFLFFNADLTWPSRFDEWQPTTSHRLAPFGSRTHHTQDMKWLPLKSHMANDSDVWDDYLDDPRTLALIDVTQALCWQINSTIMTPMTPAHEIIVRKLLRLGANPTTAWLQKPGHVDLTRILLDFGLDPNHVVGYTQVALQSLLFAITCERRRTYAHIFTTSVIHEFQSMLQHNATVFQPLSSIAASALGNERMPASIVNYIERIVFGTCSSESSHMGCPIMRDTCLRHMNAVVSAGRAFEGVLVDPMCALQSRPLLNVIWEYVFADPWQLVLQSGPRVNGLMKKVAVDECARRV